MYKSPEMGDYLKKWIEAERDLAIMGVQLQPPLPHQDMDIPVELGKDAIPIEPPIENDTDSFSKEDFIRSLKKVSRPVGKEKS
jgi:hypothetical protein